MQAFSHTNAKTLAEAETALADGQATLIAGGTDLLGRLKDNILSTYPGPAGAVASTSRSHRERNAVDMPGFAAAVVSRWKIRVKGSTL